MIVQSSLITTHLILFVHFIWHITNIPYIIDSIQLYIPIKSDYAIGHVLYNNRADWLTSWPEEEDVSQDTMTIFIIKKSVYDTVPWDSIAKNYMILQRYDVPAQYYMDHFWPRKHLAYPPTEDMREIPMWPAYETDK